MVNEAGEVVLAGVQWSPSWRLVPSRFPTKGVFDSLAGNDELKVLYEIEGLTNSRLRDEIGDIHLVADEDRVFGPGTTAIMAAFTHRSRTPSRFTDGRYGVYYAAKSINTAIAETLYHRERFLRETNLPPTEIDMRSYASDIDTDLHDIRGQQDALANVYNPDPAGYGAGQALASRLREGGSNGIVYDSVRDPGGECVAIFKPRVLAPTVQGKHYAYVWDGETIAHVYAKEWIF